MLSLLTKQDNPPTRPMKWGGWLLLAIGLLAASLLLLFPQPLQKFIAPPAFSWLLPAAESIFPKETLLVGRVKASALDEAGQKQLEQLMQDAWFAPGLITPYSEKLVYTSKARATVLQKLLALLRLGKVSLWFGLLPPVSGSEEPNRFWLLPSTEATWLALGFKPSREDANFWIHKKARLQVWAVGQRYFWLSTEAERPSLTLMPKQAEALSEQAEDVPVLEASLRWGALLNVLVPHPNYAFAGRKGLAQRLDKALKVTSENSVWSQRRYIALSSESSSLSNWLLALEATPEPPKRPESLSSSNSLQRNQLILHNADSWLVPSFEPLLEESAQVTYGIGTELIQLLGLNWQQDGIGLLAGKTWVSWPTVDTLKPEVAQCLKSTHLRPQALNCLPGELWPQVITTFTPEKEQSLDRWTTTLSQWQPEQVNLKRWELGAGTRWSLVAGADTQVKPLELQFTVQQNRLSIGPVNAPSLNSPPAELFAAEPILTPGFTLSLTSPRRLIQGQVPSKPTEPLLLYINWPVTHNIESSPTP